MKSKLMTLNLGILIAIFAIFLSACNNDDNDMQPELPIEQNIVEIAVANPNFSSLVAALTNADLASTLEGNGPFTVFAPTNDAFASFLSANGFSSLDEVPNEILTQILLNHVVSGSIKSTDLTQGYVSTVASEKTTSNPISLYVDLSSGVRLNGVSSVTTADIEASNGIIHVVDAVIGVPSVVTHALANENFSILVAALTREDLSTDFVSILSGSGPFTVFAPTNDAFQTLLDSNPDWNNLGDIPAATLEAVLSYHVVGGANVLSSSLSNGQIVEALSKDTFTINIVGGNVSITDENNRTSNIIAVDVQGINGVIHVIEQVILPQ
jgi:uncharacterized surface protein with fasciclin (FAS1) repeats